MNKKLLIFLLASLPLSLVHAADPAPTAARATAKQPNVVKAVNPEYPEQARVLGIEGQIVVDCIVGADGKVLAVTSLAEENLLLKEAALAAVKQWEFAPREGNNDPYLVHVPINFDLQSRAEALEKMNIAAR